jgi:hypothetical protein
LAAIPAQDADKVVESTLDPAVGEWVCGPTRAAIDTRPLPRSSRIANRDSRPRCTPRSGPARAVPLGAARIPVGLQSLLEYRISFWIRVRSGQLNRYHQQETMAANDVNVKIGRLRRMRESQISLNIPE